ncbi:MAG: macro domain-containing protein [bacterium]
MVDNAQQKDIDHHLNNLVFSLYNFAKAQQKKAENNDSKEENPSGTIIPLEILKMLKRKIGKNLTKDEDRLFSIMINDLEGKPKKSDEKIEQISIIEQQAELLKNPETRPYKFSSIVESAFSMVRINKTIIQVMLGDLTVHPVEAIVSPDTTELWMEQGVASVIRLKGGDSIRKEARKAGAINLGGVLVTEAGELTQRYIFHTAIMPPEKETKPEYIRLALENIFLTSEDKKIKSIAIPSIGIASSKIPYDVISKIMVQHIFSYFLSKSITSINLIVISLFNRQAYDKFIIQFKDVAKLNSLAVEDYS